MDDEYEQLLRQTDEAARRVVEAHRQGKLPTKSVVTSESEEETIPGDGIYRSTIDLTSSEPVQYRWTVSKEVEPDTQMQGDVSASGFAASLSEAKKQIKRWKRQQQKSRK